MDFEKITGHKRQIEILKRAIDMEKINHFYLFKGEKGTGKTDVALAFSKTILCKADSGRPCNDCNSCIRFNTGNHPDFKMLQATKGFIRKEEVEDMIDDISILPFEGGKKIYLIEDLDVVKPETQNLLLKTLEEPPNYVVIIIVTSNANKILATILSRCQSISFYKEGNIEDLFNLEDLQEIRENTIDIIDNLIKGNKIKAFTSMDFFTKNKDKIDDILDIMLYWFRDLAIYKEIGDSEIILNKENLDKLQAQSSLDIKQIYDIIDKIEASKINIARNINFNLSIETMLLNI